MKINEKKDILTKKIFTILILTVAFALFLAGCVKSPEYTHCCGPGEPPDYLVDCELPNGTVVNIPCNPDNDTCDYDELNITICVKPELSSCIKDACKAMICGDQKYDPSPKMSHCDITEILAGNIPNDSLSLEGLGKNIRAQNLYQAKCSFETLSKSTYEKMERSNGALWINSFRLGVGHSFSDYNDARLYFPISDRFCSLNTAGWKDRYLNYLNYDASALCIYNTGSVGWICTAPSGYGEYFNSTLLGNDTAKLACENYCQKVSAYDLTNCTTTADHPLFLDASGSYKTAFNTYYGYSRCASDSDASISSSISSALCDTEVIDPLVYVGRLIGGILGLVEEEEIYGCVSPFRDEADECYPLASGGNPYHYLYEGTVSKWSGIIINEAEFVNYPYYSILLRNQFESQIKTGHTDLNGVLHSGMEFECQSDAECFSSLCGRQNYNRFACVNRSNEIQDIECGVKEDVLAGQYFPAGEYGLNFSGYRYSWSGIGYSHTLLEFESPPTIILSDSGGGGPGITYTDIILQVNFPHNEIIIHTPYGPVFRRYSDLTLSPGDYLGHAPPDNIIDFTDFTGTSYHCEIPYTQLIRYDCVGGGYNIYSYSGSIYRPIIEMCSADETTISSEGYLVFRYRTEVNITYSGGWAIDSVDCYAPTETVFLPNCILSNGSLIRDVYPGFSTITNISEIGGTYGGVSAWSYNCNYTTSGGAFAEPIYVYTNADPDEVFLINECGATYYIETFDIGDLPSTIEPASYFGGKTGWCAKVLTDAGLVTKTSPLWSDGNDCYLIADRRIVITDLGDCKITADGRIELRDYGWCEPCTEVTMALQEVNSIDKYCPAGIYEFDGDITPYCSLDRMDSCGEGDRWEDARCHLCLNGPKEDYACYGSVKWPSVDPEISYLYNSIKAYQQSNVLPILDIKDPKLLTSETIALPGGGFWPPGGGSHEFEIRRSIFKHDVFEEGAVIIIVGTLNDSNADEMYSLASIVKANCPLCLTALHASGSTTAEDIANIERLDDFFNYGAFASGDPRLSLDQNRLDAVDIIAYDFYPHKYAEIDGLDNPEDIVNQKIEFSRTLLAHYGKPSLISDFNIEEPSVVEGSAEIVIDLQLAERHCGDFEDCDEWKCSAFAFDRSGDVKECTSTSDLIFCSLDLGGCEDEAFCKNCGPMGIGNKECPVVRHFTALINFAALKNRGGNITNIVLVDERAEDAIGRWDWPNGRKDIAADQNWYTKSERGLITKPRPVGEVGGTHHGFDFGAPVTEPCEGSDLAIDCGLYGSKNLNLNFANTDKWIKYSFAIFAGEGADDENAVEDCDWWDATGHTGNEDDPNSKDARGKIVTEIKYTIPPTGYFANASNIDEFYYYLFTHQRDMTDVGIIGLVYRDWEGTEHSDLVFNGVKGDNFCAFQRESRKLLGIETQEMYLKVYAPENMSCECVNCSQIDVLTGGCNPYCSDGKECDGYVTGTNVKCPLFCARPLDDPNGCDLCNDSDIGGESYSCEFYYSDGTHEAGPSGLISDLTKFDSDIIANLPANKKCCIWDEEINASFTFDEIKGKKYNSELIIYPKDGDENIDCKGPKPIEYCVNESPFNINMKYERGELICR
ncbi:hypothetical protein DRN85_04810 [Methanosarcinales archaeon]|nr:MAG: hypothetical protein DRN85_04810 [Methanosarcinales archaeon]